MRTWILCALLVAAPSARADEAADGERARTLFHDGERRYDQGDYVGALEQFQEARRLRPAAELDYDIARCWDRLGRIDDAIREYRHYLSASPNAPNAAVVQARLAALEEQRGALTGPQEAAAERASRRRRIAPIAVGAAAAVVGLVATGLVASVKPDYDDLARACNHLCMPSQWASLEARANAGYALFGVAGALAVTDIVLWAVTARRARGL
jgi:tetratricopeptide (TPR) repeat protein